MITKFYDLHNININSEVEFDHFLKATNRIDINDSNELKEFIFYLLEKCKELQDEKEEIISNTDVEISNLQNEIEDNEEDYQKQYEKLEDELQIEVEKKNILILEIEDLKEEIKLLKK